MKVASRDRGDIIHFAGHAFFFNDGTTEEQQGYLTANGMRHVAGILDMTAADVEGEGSMEVTASDHLGNERIPVRIGVIAEDTWSDDDEG